MSCRCLSLEEGAGDGGEIRITHKDANTSHSPGERGKTEDIEIKRAQEGGGEATIQCANAGERRRRSTRRRRSLPIKS